MNARGQYGSLGGPGRTFVGASLVHVLELKQRYDNVKTVAAQALLNDLSKDGTVSSVATNRWEIALKDAAWVRLAWYPDFFGLEITITDRELHRSDEVASIRRRYEAILRRITPRLTSFGATTVGAATAYSGAAVDTSWPGPGDYHAELPDRLYGFTSVGLMMFNTPDDSDVAARQIDTEFNAIMDAMYRAMGADPSVRKPPFSLKEAGKLAKGSAKDREILDAWRESVRAAKAITTKSPLWPFFESVASPQYDEWMQFRSDDKFMTWFRPIERYEHWLKRVGNLREQVRSKGIKLETPAPIDLTKTLPGTVIDTAGEAAKKTGEAIWEFGKILKWGVIGVLGIGAVVALSSVVSNLRSGKDPGEKYMEMIRQRRQSCEPREPRAPRAPRELPVPRARRALPSGELGEPALGGGA